MVFVGTGCHPGKVKGSPATEKSVPGKGRIVNPWCHLHLNRKPVHSHERANTHSALNASPRSGYSGKIPFPLSLSEPFAGEPSAGSQRSPLSVGVPSGLTFASKVSVFGKKNNMDPVSLSTFGMFFGCICSSDAAGCFPYSICFGCHFDRSRRRSGEISPQAIILNS